MNKFIAMNRFKIAIGRESDFEDIWKNRDTHIVTLFFVDFFR
jgi:heme-degrading monooxygenase HmoA